MDLFGSDLPVEADEGMQFAWSDGILLQVCLYSSSRMACFFQIKIICIDLLYFQALKQGSWVLLDELNLASQSVLEV